MTKERASIFVKQATGKIKNTTTKILMLPDKEYPISAMLSSKQVSNVRSESSINADTQNFFEQNPESKHLRDVLEDLRLETIESGERAYESREGRARQQNP